MERMKHLVNESLPKGEYRVICTNCQKVYVHEAGNFTQAALAAEGIQTVCDVCHGEVILETNPKDERPKYDKDYPYPNDSNC